MARSRVERPLYHAFCDESCIRAGAHRGFRIQGGIWVPDGAMRSVRRWFSALRAKHPTINEFKWEKIRGPELRAVYADLLKLFAAASQSGVMTFKCIVIHKSDDPTSRSDPETRDLGFYKAYYTFLLWRLKQGSDNLIRLHRRSSPLPNPEHKLMECLNATATRDERDFKVVGCGFLDSCDDDLLQLADVLCGVVGWAWNGQRSSCAAKPAFHQALCSALGWGTLIERETWASEARFNVWRYRPTRRGE